MSILVYIDHDGGQLKKSSLETTSYAAKIAGLLGGVPVIGVAFGNISNETLSGLGAYGMSKVLHADSADFNHFDSRPYTKAIAEAAQKVGATLLIFSNNSSGKSLAPRLSVRLNAALAAGATQLPTQNGNSLVIRKSVFSGKAFAEIALNTPIKIISLNPNAFPIAKTGGTATVENFQPSVTSADFTVKVQSVERLSNSVPLPEAELVVSAGRGMKGPENWGLIEELASELGAATACSRPVSDVGWRPHHEHVGQTGITVRPNLYIAVGISGAIQHLAGVNNSKVIVVINKDSDAPFFKAADYGIVGDAFEVLPRLIQSVKKFNAQHG